MRDRSQLSSSPFASLQASAQVGLSDVSVLRSLACPPSTQSPLSVYDSLSSFEGLAIANVTQFSEFQTVTIDVWGGRNAADSYLVCAVKASLPQPGNGSSANMQLISVTSSSGHATSSASVLDAAASVGSFRSWLGGDPYYATSHKYKRYDEFATVFGQAFARLLPDAPCALVTFGENGLSSASRYRMTFKFSFASPALTAFDFWVAPTLFTSLQSPAEPSVSIQALVVRGSKFGVSTRSAQDVFPAQPSSGCCPVATVPSPLYPGRCVLCSDHIFSSSSIASWQPLNGSVSAADAGCSLPFAASAASCNQSAQSCSCSSGRGMSMCELRLPLPATSTQALVQALCSKWTSTFDAVKQGTRTHAGIAAVALSDFVTDAAGLIDAHDVARVLLQLHSSGGDLDGRRPEYPTRQYGFAGTCTGCDGSGAFEDMYSGSKVLVSNVVYEAALTERVIKALLSHMGASSSDCPIALKIPTAMPPLFSALTFEASTWPPVI